MRIIVDDEICVGSGQCEARLPDVFLVGVKGFVTVDALAAGSHSRAELERVVSSCPTGALGIDG